MPKILLLPSDLKFDNHDQSSMMLNILIKKSIPIIHIISWDYPLIIPRLFLDYPQIIPGFSMAYAWVWVILGLSLGNPGLSL